VSPLQTVLNWTFFTFLFAVLLHLRDY